MKKMNHSYSLLGVTDSYAVRTTLYVRQLLFSQSMYNNNDIIRYNAAYFGTDSSTLKTEGKVSSKMLGPVYHQTAQSIIT